jgi:hypothetical protein
VRRTPAGLGLDDVAPELDLAEDATHRPGLVAPPRIRKGVGRIACGMEAAAADRTRDRVRRHRFGERVFVASAFGDEWAAERPEDVV